MGFRLEQGFPIFGEHDAETLSQLIACARAGDAYSAALMADGHKGYSMPIGGVVAYRSYISPSGVGYDIACGNKAIRTNLVWGDIKRDLARIMDEIFNTVSFGLGRKNNQPTDHELYDDPIWKEIPEVGALRPLAMAQEGTVGAGNHYVDILVEVDSPETRIRDLPDSAPVWVANHHGSRGLGHKIASGFLNLAAGRDWHAPAPGESMDQPPALIKVDSELGQAYIAAMQLAGKYAYAGRDYSLGQVMEILGARETFVVHVHHNFAWLEEHGGEKLWVVRKGATPLWPGQYAFIGGSMGDIAVVVRGVDSPTAKAALYSAMHGAGRIMSRTKAAGKWKKVGGKRVRVGGAIDMDRVRKRLQDQGLELRGAGADEAPDVYRPLTEVLKAHEGTLKVVHMLRPVGVAMAGADEYDPYKD